MELNLFKIPEEEIKKIGIENQIYGFATLYGLKNISNIINNIMKKNKIEYLYGIDLGCGDGMTIDYFNKYVNNSNWIGIEMSTHRINLSTYKNNNYIIEGDFLKYYLGDYNFIYLNNLAFDDILLEKIENKISIEFTGFIITSKIMDSVKINKCLSRFGQFYADTNWQKNHIFYISAIL